MQLRRGSAASTRSADVIVDADDAVGAVSESQVGMYSAQRALGSVAASGECVHAAC